MADETKKTALGLTENFSAMVCYLFGWVSGLVVFLLEKDNKFVRFHAMQSVIVFGGLLVLNIVLGAIPVLGWAVAVLVWPLSIVLWIVLMVKAYRGEKFKIPVAGDMAEKQAG
ncbi:MAG: DUF4870 domain-containing protein [Spirochaetia bacterium]|nr:DUF4870 domain-containing protein [Spirochaetia bacterium]